MARSSTTRPRTSSGDGSGSAPVPVALPRRRTFSDLLRAFGAFLALAVLVGGVPFGLVVFIGWPLPHTMPDLSTLQQQVTPTTFLDALGVAVWLAWAQFTACVLVEFKGAVSGVGLPTRIPGAGGSQALARQLVAALLLISAGAMSFAPGLDALGQHSSEPVRAAASISAQRVAGGSHAGAAVGEVRSESAPQGPGAEVNGSADASATSAGAASGTKFYRVLPPDGRHHDSLWEIAQRHLGDGRRYEQIYQLNKDRVQPDGSKLTKAGLIRPGWILEMPADATGGDLVDLHEAAPAATPVRPQSPESGATAGQHGGSGTDAATATETVGAQEAAEVVAYAEHGPHPIVEADPGVTLVVTPVPAVAPPTPVAEAPVAEAPVVPSPVSPTPVAHTPTEHVSAAPADEQPAAAVPAVLLDALAASPLLAAGLLAALGRRRRARLWRGAVGLFPSAPQGRAADAEDSLRIGADPDQAEFLTTALRGLAALLAAEGRTLPTLYAVWLTPDTVFLQLPWSHGLPPAPWQVDEAEDGAVGNCWELNRADLTAPYRRAAGSAAAAPFPGLVGLGSHEGSRLLMNLEAAPGLITLAGPLLDRNAVLAAFAAELATNTWSDRMSLTLVGFDCDLTELAPDRVHHLPTIDMLLTSMESEADSRRAALDAAGLDSVLTGRGSAANATAWSPHLVLVAAEPDPAQAQRLAGLAADAGRLGIGYVVARGTDELPGAAWELRIDADGHIRAPLLGLDVLAQRLPRTEVDAVLQLFALTGPSDGARDGSPQHGTGTGLPSASDVVDLRKLGAPALQVGLLGEFALTGTGVGLSSTEPERLPQLQEALVLLLLHREGLHPAVLVGSLWPGGVTEDVATAFVDRLRTWLGRDARGQWRLTGDTDDSDGRMRLDTSVQSDWDLFRSLREVALYGSEAAVDSGTKERTLAEALLLVRGPFLADRPDGRYAWLRHELIEAQVPSLVADTALALSALRAARGEFAGAAQAVEQGLLCAPYDERLVRERLRAVHATGDQARFAALLDELLSRSDTARGGRGLPARTQALLDELHPSWRGRIAV